MKVIVSKPAENDLERHWDFLLEAYDEAYALRTLKLIDSGILFLGKHPSAGQYEVELDHLGRGHRRWVVGHYKIIYLILENHLVITDIFDSRQDPGKMKG